jgi:ribose-phosphate pyrophosphokinase
MTTHWLPDNEILVQYDSGDPTPLSDGRYPDGMPLIVPPERAPRAMLVRPASFETLFVALAFVDALAARALAVPRLVLPCVPGGRQDRTNDSGDYLFTLRTVADAINARRFPSVTVIDPHSDVTPALIERCAVAAPVLGTARLDRSYVGVIAPDCGATRRAARIASEIGVPLYHAWKTRDVSTGRLAGFGCEDLPPGLHLIADDLCDGGGTFIGLAQAIANQGIPAVTLDLYVTHGLFTKGVAELHRYFGRIYCTDSVIGDKSGLTVIHRCAGLLSLAANP